MNKYFLLSLAAAFAVTLTGCFSAYQVNFPEPEFTTVISEAPPTAEAPHNPSPLWSEASPETSMLTYYIYDGETVVTKMLSDIAMEREILSTLEASSGVPLEKWSPEDITYPIYGIYICKKDGSPLQAVWTNNFLILNDGSAYKFDLDTSNWAERYTFEPDLEHEFKDTSVLPCADYLLRTETGWNFDLMTEAELSIDPLEGITLEPVSSHNNTITVKYINNNAERQELTYGLSFTIHAENNGVWYTIPTTSDMHYGFAAIAMVLMPDQSSEETYSTDMYGSLPDGHYRLYANGLTLEFDLADNNIMLP